jgi:hypothetical protein
MIQRAGLLGIAALVAASPCTAQVTHPEDTQSSLNIRLLEATIFCMKWVGGTQSWSPAALGMEDIRGAPKAGEPGEAWDYDHDLDIGIVALEPRTDGCKVLLRTDKWDKNASVNLIVGWLVRGHYSLFSKNAEGGATRLFFTNADGSSVFVNRYAVRPPDGDSDHDSDASIFFFSKG